MLPVQNELRKHADQKRARVSANFFKTGKGQYGEGDQFLGITVPQIREVAKQFSQVSFEDVDVLLDSPWHEDRLAGCLILVQQYANKKATDKEKKRVYDFYMKHAQRINNWDLVDLTADKIVGNYLLPRERKILYDLAQSTSLWERRIAIVSTFAFIRNNQFDDTFSLSQKLLQDNHDLMHKACGWMLREVGKRDENVLKNFLKKHAQRMPRTMLRYAIEKFPETERKAFLAIKPRV